MALAYTKAGWNFERYLYAYEQNGDLAMQHWWFGIKDTLVRLGWEVRGGLSSVALAHNTLEAYGAWSGTDPWPTAADTNRTGSDMYIILRSPTGFEICMGSNYSSQTSYMYFCFVYISHAAGFGSVYSGSNGTGGTGAVPPTATDQQQIYAHNVNGGRNGLQDTPGTLSMYGAQSTDDQSTRLVVQLQRGINFWLSYEHLDNPHVNLDNSGQVCAVRIVDDNEQVSSPMDGDFYTAARYYGRVSGVNRAFYTGTHGYANLGHHSHHIVQQDNKMVVAPMDLYQNTLGLKGYYGTIPDLYYGNNNHFMQLLGDSVGGIPNWFSGGSIISPWDGDLGNGGANPEPLPRVY